MAFDSLPEHRKWDHAIELEREPSPGFHKVYPMTLTEQTEMDTFLEEALATGCIRQSKSPLGAPVFFIKKKDGKLRFVQDHQALNAITRKNRYPLSLINDLIHQLKDARYFTKLDVRWGYNNVHIREGDEWKAAFCTNRGLFEPLVMYFGLTNSPATFQTMMNEIFQDLITEGVISVRGHLSISLPYLLYSLLSPPALSTPTPLCAYVHIITEGRRPLSPIVNDFAY
jgi:hypothetical protein